MAGRPKLNALEQRLDALAAEEGLSALEWVAERIADGQSVLGLAKELGISRGLLRAWIARTEERTEAVDRARREAAPAHLENAEAMLDDLADKEALSSADVQLASHRVGIKKHLASIADPRYNPSRSDVNINFNLADTHLRVLQEMGAPPRLPEPVIEAEYEEIPDDE